MKKPWNEIQKENAKNEFIKKLDEFEYILLSEYTNSHTKVLLECPKGHEWKVKPIKFKMGNRCPSCSTNCPEQSKRRLLSEIVDSKYFLISEYKNNKTKIMLVCNNRHVYYTTPDYFKGGRRCPKCPRPSSVKKGELFESLLDKEGYNLLSDNALVMEKVTLMCPEGHEWKVKPNDFKNGIRCPKCSDKCPEQAKERFIKALETDGYSSMSEYKGAMIKTKVSCPSGHEYFTKPSDFKTGYRCPECHYIKTTIKAKDEFMNLLLVNEYNLLSEYKNTSIKVAILCPEGHEWKVKPNDFKNGIRCPHCAGSTGQRELQKRLSVYDFGSVIYNDREVLNGLELDIYFPELNTAIEYQGNYWHSKPEAIKRDEKKRKLCSEMDINLIEVWDDDFMSEPDKTVNEILSQIRII